MTTPARPFVFGINPIGGEEAQRDIRTHDPKMFRAIADIGGTIVRIGFNWNLLEPVKGEFDWDYLDWWVDMSVDNNLAVVGLINSVPSWASPTGKDTPFYAPRMENRADFEHFVRELAVRYKGRIKFWEFWNEANGFGWHSDMGYNLAEEYVPWLKICYQVLKDVDPGCLVGLTGLDDADGHGPVYLQKVYDLGGKGYFDAVIDHPYYKGGPHQRGKIFALRKMMDEHGDSDLPIWITEMGWPITDQEEAVPGYVEDYLNQISGPDFDFVPISTYHTICDFSYEEVYGLTDRDMNPRPAYQVFKDYPKPARPMITSAKVESAGTGAVEIVFGTDLECESEVLYGPTRNYGSEAEGERTKEHRVEIAGLEQGSLYQYRVVARVGTYNFSFSGDGEFTAN